MWCYQKPGFGSLLLAELQRQQQCSLFCDTMLQTDGISLPAHSCILSAISPCISSSLSSTLPLPAGHHHLLDFQSLGAYTLLNLVRLLYSGEMVGEGEEERIKAVSAAAKLGIYGLVEVSKGREEEEEEEEEEEGGGGGDRGMDVGVQTVENDRARSSLSEEECTERLSKSGKDVWTQTEDHTASPPQPVSIYETIDLDVFRDLAENDLQNLTPQISYIPVSYVHPLIEPPLPLSAPMDSMQGPTAAGHTAALALPPPFQSTSSGGDAQGSIVAAEEWQNEELQQSEGDIPRYSNYFLSSDEAPHQAQTNRPQTVKKRGGRGKRRGGRPSKRMPGRMRQSVGLLQKVNLQEVKVSKLQMKFLQRWGMRTTRTGQGGGVTGRRWDFKTRKQLCQERRGSSRRRSGGNKVWELSPSRGVQLCKGGAGKRRRGWNSTTPQLNQVSFPDGSAQTVTAQLTTSCPPGSSLLAATPPLQEPFNHLIEEAMMGLYALPNGNAPAPPPDSRPPAPHKQDWISLLLGADSGCPTQICLQEQQQGEKEELNNILDIFLGSFEQHLDRCLVQEQTPASALRHSEEGVEVNVCSQPCKDSSDHSAIQPKISRAASQRHRKRRKGQSALLQGRRKMMERNSVLVNNDNKIISHHDGVDKQLLQIPVVRLRRNKLLPLTVKLQDICPYLDVKTPSTPNISSSTLKQPSNDNPESWNRKSYPIRSHYKCTGIVPVVQEPHEYGRSRKSRKKKSRLRSETHSRCSVPPPQTHVRQARQRQESLQGREERVQPQNEEVEEPSRSGKKRRSESDKETNADDEALAKRICESSCESETAMQKQDEDLLTCEIKLNEPSLQMERGVVSGGAETKHLWNKSALTLSSSKASSSSREDMDEDIDVIGVVSPAPAPVVISWPEEEEKEEEEEEEEEVDVLGEV